MVEHQKCTGKDHVDKELKRIIALGGEGLMIRQLGSKYERKRSDTLLKIKTFYDAKAKLIGFVKTKSNPDLISSYLVEMANGIQFKIGSG
ncbi:hypothetical protein DPMN_170080 [Dreissena polymorpha]|uniref:DNA ligase n=1 Tax=Dreissena polymorpha TaxID=45954 RepID=A0A9D4DVR7_DREPO|nr:hypothetical protein DPMN_170080 [Dreissena polymorpha]